MSDLERLVDLAKELNLPEDALDEAVHTATQEESLSELNATDEEDEEEAIIYQAECRASGINNGGIESQIEYLLEGNKPETVEQLLRSSRT